MCDKITKLVSYNTALSDQDLLNKIQLSSDAYYVGEAIMSDTEYDELLDYLKTDRPHLIDLS